MIYSSIALVWWVRRYGVFVDMWLCVVFQTHHVKFLLGSNIYWPISIIKCIGHVASCALWERKKNAMKSNRQTLKRHSWINNFPHEMHCVRCAALVAFASMHTLLNFYLFCNGEIIHLFVLNKNEQIYVFVDVRNRKRVNTVCCRVISYVIR